MKSTIKQKGFLIDGTKCIGCRACQVACKQWNELPAEKTEFFGGPGYQNPANLSSKTYTLIKYREIEKKGQLIDWTFHKSQCQHCLEPACEAACIVGAFTKTAEGPVEWDEKKCIGCRYCMLACPYQIPTFEWSSINPKIRKCTLCSDRIKNGLQPACSKACSTGAILFGNRDELLKIAKQRLKAEPKKYYQHIYGENEVGGTCVLNISSVALDKEFGYPKNLPNKAMISFTEPAMKSIPGVVMGLGALLGISAYIVNKHNRNAAAESDSEGGSHE